jgi:hypothetical protein
LVSATSLQINISVTLSVDTVNNFTLDTAKANIITNITEYLQSIAFVNDYVSYAHIGSTIFNSEGVTDYSNLLVNAGTSNIPIGSEEVAIIGSVVVPSA